MDHLVHSKEMEIWPFKRELDCVLWKKKKNWKKSKRMCILWIAGPQAFFSMIHHCLGCGLELSFRERFDCRWCICGKTILWKNQVLDLTPSWICESIPKILGTKTKSSFFVLEKQDWIGWKSRLLQKSRIWFSFCFFWICCFIFLLQNTQNCLSPKQFFSLKSHLEFQKAFRFFDKMTVNGLCCLVQSATFPPKNWKPSRHENLHCQSWQEYDEQMQKKNFKRYLRCDALMEFFFFSNAWCDNWKTRNSSNATLTDNYNALYLIE